MEKNLIGIVIVNYNGEKFQNNCIDTILKNTYQNFRIIVVDNKSTDKSMEQLLNIKDKRIVPILCNENYGVAKGNNIGIAKSIELGCEYTLLLNNDTLLESTLFENLLNNMEEKTVCVPKMYLGDGKTIWYGGGTFLIKRGNCHHYHFMEEEKNFNYPTYCEYAPTTCMLIPNSLFEKVGFIDDKYFLYYDDVDFCFRFNKIGYRVKFCKDSSIKHLVGQSSGGDESIFSIYYMTRNKFYFVNKFKKDFNFLTRTLILIDKRIKYIKGKIRKNNYRIIKKAIQDYRHGLMGRCDNLVKEFK